MGQAPGFFGKVPSHGDFVGRRLPPDVRQRFDDWLQGALLRSRQDLGAEWLPTWLSSPLWRFVVSAGVCGEQAWAGVMMPSHDRVGRCFPLLLLAGIDGTPLLRDCLTVHDGWFAQLEELALSTLKEGFSLAAFDENLLALSPLTTVLRSRGNGAVQARRAVTEIAGDVLPALADEDLDGRTALWTNGSPQVAPCIALCTGVPEPWAYAALLDGRWEEHGWAGL